jgi:hypothetical protein
MTRIRRYKKPVKIGQLCALVQEKDKRSQVINVHQRLLSALVTRITMIRRI